MPTVYLAGGFRSGWQGKVHTALKGWRVLDPSAHGLLSPREYARWDLDAITESDMVLAYMERTNPGGYSLALEVGFAKALAKMIILVEEHDSDERRRYFEMVREVADKRFPSLDEAIVYLQDTPAGPLHTLKYP